MADTTTANLSLTKPEPLAAAGANLWGPKLNTDFDLIDAIFEALGAGTSVGLQVGTGKKLKVTGTGELNVASGATLVLKGTTITALTTFAATILDDTTQAAARTTLGLGTTDAPSFGASVSVTADPTTALQLATKQYVDSLAVNVGKRGSVRAATTANIAIATALNNGDSLDGLTLATGELVLVKNQTAPAENGVYVVGVTPARSAEFDTFNEHPGSLIAVEEGTANTDTLWLCTANDGGTLNTTAITFNQMVVSGALLAANNLSDLANATTARSNLGVAIGSQVQAWDATLDALAAADWVLNSFPIGSGANTLTQVAFAVNTFPARASTGNLVAKAITDFALTILDDADAGTVRATIGAQASDATLTAFAALTIAAESLTIGTGADAFTQVTFAANTFPARASTGSLVAKTLSDFALTLLDDADAAAARATLGLDGSAVLLSTTTISNVATVDLPFTAGYTRYEARLINVLPASAAALWLRTSADSGSTYDAAATSYEYGYVADGAAATTSTGAAQLVTSPATIDSGAGTGGICSEFTVFNPLGTVHRKNIRGQSTHRDSGGTNVTVDFSGNRDATAALTHLRIMFSTGNLSTGTIKWYGIP